MLNKNIGYLYLIVQIKNMSSEIVSGIKASILLKEIIEIEEGSYLFVKQINNSKHRNSIVINTIQKIYDLFINKSVKVYIVDNKDTAYTNFTKNKNVVSLDDLYSELDFKCVSKLVHKSNSLYFAISYIDEIKNTKHNYLFPTNYISRELFERNHLLNNYTSDDNNFDFDNTEIKLETNDTDLTDNELEDPIPIPNITNILNDNDTDRKQIEKNNCEKCELFTQMKDKFIIGSIIILSFSIVVLYKFQYII